MYVNIIQPDVHVTPCRYVCTHSTVFMLQRDLLIQFTICTAQHRGDHSINYITNIFLIIENKKIISNKELICRAREYLSAKCLPCKEELKFVPQNPHLKSQARWNMLVITEQQRQTGDPWGSLASQPNQLREVQDRRALVSKEKVGGAEKQHWMLSSGPCTHCTHTYTHTHTHTHAHNE